MISEETYGIIYNLEQMGVSLHDQESIYSRVYAQEPNEPAAEYPNLNAL